MFQVDADDTIIENVDEGTDVVYATVSYTLGANVEWLSLVGYGTGTIGIGNPLDNVLSGNSLDNTLDGGIGIDTLFGAGGGDTLYGGADADTITGGAGADTMYGGADADTFWWNSIGETGLAVPTMDLIADFNFAEGDRINLVSIDADVYAAGNQGFSFIGTAGFTLAPDGINYVPGEINYYHSGGETIIQLQAGIVADIDGGIRLSGIHTPDVDWFIL